MKNKLLDYRKKLDKFNKWEIEYSRNLSTKKRLKQFEQLFLLANEYPEEIKKLKHEEHLQNLISIKQKEYKAQKLKDRDERKRIL